MERFAYKKLDKYPHFMPYHIGIWEKFISNNPGFFERVDYDIKVGTGMKLPPEAEEPYKSDLIELSKKRIDVIGYKKNVIYIIEIKPRAGLQAIGQALGLQKLYDSEYSGERKTYPCIISDSELADMKDLCSKMGIIYLIA